MTTYVVRAVTSNGGDAQYAETSRRAAERLARHLVGNGYAKAWVWVGDEAIGAWALDTAGRTVRVNA